MAITNLDLTASQGRVFDVDDDGTRLNFGRPIRKLMLLIPSGSQVVYFTLGKAGLLEDAVDTEVHLEVTYPSLHEGDVYELSLANVMPQTVELRCASGDTVSKARVILI